MKLYILDFAYLIHVLFRGNFKKLRIYKELFELVDDDDNKDYLKFNGDQNILNDEYLEYYVNHLNKRNLHVEELKSLLNDLLIKDIDDRGEFWFTLNYTARQSN